LYAAVFHYTINQPSSSHLVLQSITGVSISDLSTPVSLANFQMAIVKAVAYSLNLYSIGGNVSPPGNNPDAYFGWIILLL